MMLISKFREWLTHVLTSQVNLSPVISAVNFSPKSCADVTEHVIETIHLPLTVSQLII